MDLEDQKSPKKSSEDIHEEFSYEEMMKNLCLSDLEQPFPNNRCALPMLDLENNEEKEIPWENLADLVINVERATEILKGDKIKVSTL